MRLKVSDKRSGGPAAYVLLAVIAALLTGGCSYIGADRPAAKQYGFQIGSTQLNVDAQQRGGTVKASPAEGGVPAIKGVAHVADPVRLDMDGGQLDSAKLTFGVKPDALAALPKQVTDPGPFFDVFTRSPATGNKWVWAGPGEYDPAAKTVSFQADHFSDWTYGMTDFDELERQKQLTEKAGLLVTTIYGETPVLDCPRNELPLTYAIDDPTKTNSVKACATMDPKSRRVRVELINTSATELAVTPPPGFTTRDDVLTGDGFIADAFAASRKVTNKANSLRGQDKLVYIASADAARSADRNNSAFQLKLDKTSVFENTSIAALNIVLGNTDPDDREENSKLAGEVLESREYADCVSNVQNQYEQGARLGETDASKYVDSFTENCAKILIEEYSKKVAERAGQKAAEKGVTAGAKRVLDGIAGGLTKRVRAVLNLKDTMKAVRQYSDGLMAATGKALIKGYGDVSVRIIPEPPLDFLPRILPPPVSGDADNRKLVSVTHAPLLPSECGGDVDFGWFVPHPRDPVGIAVATDEWAHGLQDNQGLGYDAYRLELYKIAPGQHDAVVKYVRSAKVRCPGDMAYNSGGQTYVTQTDQFGGEASVLYYRAPTEGQLSTDPASPEVYAAEPKWAAYDYLVVSGDYLAYFVVTPVNPDAPPRNKAIESYVRQTLGSFDPYLSTQFGG